MIYKGRRDIIEISRGRLDISEVYHGKRLVWGLAGSCYGTGHWINERPWLNTDAWRNA